VFPPATARVWLAPFAVGKPVAFIRAGAVFEVAAGGDCVIAGIGAVVTDWTTAGLVDTGGSVIVMVLAAAVNSPAV